MLRARITARGSRGTATAPRWARADGLASPAAHAPLPSVGRPLLRDVRPRVTHPTVCRRAPLCSRPVEPGTPVGDDRERRPLVTVPAPRSRTALEQPGGLE